MLKIRRAPIAKFKGRVIYQIIEIDSGFNWQVSRDGKILIKSTSASELDIPVPDDPLNPGEVPEMRKVRFRTLGCYPLSGAVESTATTLPEIIQEMLMPGL